MKTNMTLKHFHVVSLFPEMIRSAIEYGVLGQAVKKGLIRIDVTNPRTFTEDVHQTVDDRPYGGGDGMVMLYSPLARSVQWIKEQEPKSRVIYLSPQGRPWDDRLAREYAAQEDNLILLCGRYSGIDRRVICDYVDEEISVGDYVLSGGELPALSLIDSMVRYVPGVLGNPDSAYQETFANGLLEAPQFTRPLRINTAEVPAVLISGDHRKVEQWRFLVSLLLTYQRRQDLFVKAKVDEAQWQSAKTLFSQLSEEEKYLLGLKSKLGDESL